MTERKKGSRGQARTELVAVRFDPELKVRMECVAKSYLRSTANYVEWAVLRAIEIDEQTMHERERETLVRLMEEQGYSFDHEKRVIYSPPQQLN